MKYSPADYAENRAKYSQFRTAVVSMRNECPDLPNGEIVGIRFRFPAYNAHHGRFEPVYSVTMQGGERYHADLYASSLSDFCL